MGNPSYQGRQGILTARLGVILVALGIGFVTTSPAAAQQRPYIGLVYPAGGQQGTTFQVRLGGQNLDDVNGAFVSGPGVTARVAEYQRRMNNQEIQLLREQLKELQRGPAPAAPAAAKLSAAIQQRLDGFQPNPASAALANIVLVEVTVAADAPPGRRELTLATPRGVSNPLVFHVGQLPEVSRKPMQTATLQVLGKEAQALRKRPGDEIQRQVTLPCTLNGQIAAGEVNRYRFPARKGQRLVFAAAARALIPYLADASPGWFQPVMTLYDESGREVAYSDDYRFAPDPVILYEVPRDGQYVLTIADALYRGREDFVYRISAGELPFVTSIFPLGGRAGGSTKIAASGWNLGGAELAPPGPDATPGVHTLSARAGKLVSNSVRFALDTLPDRFEREPNGDAAHAEKIATPAIVNGRIGRPGDGDVFAVTSRAGQTLVAEVLARRLDSPLDAQLKITDAAGRLVAFNDDREDPEAGTNTHDADSYLMVKLPADGTYYVHLRDTAGHGGGEYAYRLRLSGPRPDFALYCVPSSTALRGKGWGPLAIHAVRKDGFAGPIKVALKAAPEGVTMAPTTIGPGQSVAKSGLRTLLAETDRPVKLTIEGRAQIGGREVVREAVPAEDRMQAFLWRHLVPAEQFEALVFNPSYEPPKRRFKEPLEQLLAAKLAGATKAADAKKPAAPGKAKFTPQQVAGRIREIRRLFSEGLLTEAFATAKIAECEAEL